MKKVTLICTALLFAMVTGSALAKEITDNSLDRLLTLSGVAKQTAQMPADIQTGFSQALKKDSANHQSQMSAADYEVFRKYLADSFQPSLILKSIEQETRGAVSEEDAQAMFAWYESEDGKKVTEAEETALDAASYQDMASSAKTLLANTARMQLVKDMNKLLQQTDTMIAVEENMTVTMYMAIAGSTGAELNEQSFRSEIAASLEKNRPNIEQSLALISLYLYRNIDLTTLQKYLSFLETPGARRFNDAIEAGLSKGLNQAASTMAVSITEFVQKKIEQQHTTSGRNRPPDEPASPFQE